MKNDKLVFELDARSIKFAVEYGCDLSSLDVSNVENMKGWFEWKNRFNENISKWNVTNVLDFRYMFSSCLLFNKNLDNWNINEKADVTGMFYNCTYMLKRYICNKEGTPEIKENRLVKRK